MFIGKDRSKGCGRFALLTGSSCLELGYGRFMQTDPLGYDDGLDWYNYVGNDPVNYIDPLGLSTLRVCQTHSYSYTTSSGVVTQAYNVCTNYNVPDSSDQPSNYRVRRAQRPQISETPQTGRCAGPPVANSQASQRELLERSHQNAAEARWLPPLGFRDKVRNGGPWDYKQGDAALADYGNYNYGYTGHAAGFPLGVLLRQAGRAQEAAGTSREGWGDSGLLGIVGGKAPFGDDPKDQEMIKQGYNDRANGC